MNEQISRLTHGQHPALWVVALVLLGLFGLYVFVKIEHFIVRLVTGFLGIAVVAGALWWFVTRH